MKKDIKNNLKKDNNETENKNKKDKEKNKIKSIFKDFDYDNIKLDKKYFIQLFWIFFLACFIGVVIETFFCYFQRGYFESRTALILEPLNPIYGVGAVLFTVLVIPIYKKGSLAVFVSSMFIGGIFEYVCSFMQEMIFGTISWQYGKDVLGILDRTSFIYCIFWGILGILWVKFIYPLFINLFNKVDGKVLRIITYILIVIVSFDCIFSALATNRYNQRHENVPAQNFLDNFFDKYFNDEKMKKIYPNMTFVN